MEFMVEPVDVWVASIDDRPGGLAHLLIALKEAGADLELVIARRAPDEPGKGMVFVTPLRGDREIAAAAEVGFNVTQTLHSVRIEGPNRPGIGAALTSKLGDAGVNLRGFSAAVIGTRFITYLALDTLEEAEKAVEVLRRA